MIFDNLNSFVNLRLISKSSIFSANYQIIQFLYKMYKKNDILNGNNVCISICSFNILMESFLIGQTNPID